MIIWISGPTGGGKTSLAHVFRKLGYGLVEGRISEASLSAFVADPFRHCSSLQEEIIRLRFDAWQKLPDTSRVVFDRSLDEDANVFCRMHHESEFLE